MAMGSKEQEPRENTLIGRIEPGGHLGVYLDSLQPGSALAVIVSDNLPPPEGPVIITKVSAPPLKKEEDILSLSPKPKRMEFGFSLEIHREEKEGGYYLRNVKLMNISQDNILPYEGEYFPSETCSLPLGREVAIIRDPVSLISAQRIASFKLIEVNHRPVLICTEGTDLGRWEQSRQGAGRTIYAAAEENVKTYKKNLLETQETTEMKAARLRKEDIQLRLIRLTKLAEAWGLLPNPEDKKISQNNPRVVELW